MALNWYVVRTLPKGEYLAEGELRRDGFEVLLPRAKSPNPRTGHQDLPLFPGYLFLRCDATGVEMPSLGQAAHVLGWVRFGDVAPSLPDGFVELLLVTLEDINQEGGLWRRFLQGEMVNVVSGSIENLAQVVEDTKSPTARVRVLMEFMGSWVSAQVPWESLRSIESEPKDNNRARRRTRGKGRWVRGFGSPQVVGT